MTANASPRNETLLPLDVLAINRALGKWCALLVNHLAVIDGAQAAIDFRAL